MTRINVYNYANPEDYDSETTLAGWFTTNAATRYDEDTEWDGNNHISLATGSQWDHESLYRTKGGRWVLNWWSQWEGRKERHEFITDEAAKQWLLKNNEDAAVEKWFGELEEESGPSKGGRPAIGGHVSVALGDELLASVDAVRGDNSRAEWLRQVVAAAVAESQPRDSVNA